MDLSLPSFGKNFGNVLSFKSGKEDTGRSLRNICVENGKGSRCKLLREVAKSCILVSLGKSLGYRLK